MKKITIFLLLFTLIGCNSEKPSNEDTETESDTDTVTDTVSTWHNIWDTDTGSDSDTFTSGYQKPCTEVGVSDQDSDGKCECSNEIHYYGTYPYCTYVPCDDNGGITVARICECDTENDFEGTFPDCNQYKCTHEGGILDSDSLRCNCDEESGWYGKYPICNKNLCLGVSCDANGICDNQTGECICNKSKLMVGDYPNCTYTYCSEMGGKFNYSPDVMACECDNSSGFEGVYPNCIQTICTESEGGTYNNQESICECYEEYWWSGDYPNCSPSACINQNCGPNTYCIEALGGCDCLPGYTGNTVLGCFNYNACLAYPCENNEICIDLPPPAMNEEPTFGRECVPI